MKPPIDAIGYPLKSRAVIGGRVRERRGGAAWRAARPATRDAVADPREGPSNRPSARWQPPEPLCYPPPAVARVVYLRVPHDPSFETKGIRHQPRPARQPDDPCPPGPGPR